MAEPSRQTDTAGGVTSRPLTRDRVYHFNVVYNHARCPLSATADTQLSLAWTQRAVTALRQQGLTSSYYHDRDCPRGQPMAQELGRVIAASEVTVVLLSPGFVKDCWPRYWLLSCFRSLFPSAQPASASAVPVLCSTSPPSYKYSSYSVNLGMASSTGRGGSQGTEKSQGTVLVVALGLPRADLPAVAQEQDLLVFSEDWEEDQKAWNSLQDVLASLLPVGGGSPVSRIGDTVDGRCLGIGESG